MNTSSEDIIALSGRLINEGSISAQIDATDDMLDFVNPLTESLPNEQHIQSCCSQINSLSKHTHSLLS